jgi:predicted metal-dependent hydrolase
MQGFIRENAEHEQDQDVYNQKYAEYEEQMNTVDAELQRMRQKKPTRSHERSFWKA